MGRTSSEQNPKLSGQCQSFLNCAWGFGNVPETGYAFASALHSERGQWAEHERACSGNVFHYFGSVLRPLCYLAALTVLYVPAPNARSLERKGRTRIICTEANLTLTPGLISPKTLPTRSYRMKLCFPSKASFSMAVLALASLALTTARAGASTATTTFAVSATVQATCLVAATPLAFGTYTGVAASTTSTVSVTCTNTTPYNVGLSAGLATGATVTTRKMTGPASAVLSYAMYQDSARSINWGATVGTDTVTGTGNGSAQAITIYGQLPAGQYVAPGAYSDTITATVTY